MSVEQINVLSENTDFKEVRERLDNLSASIKSFCDLRVSTDIKDTLSSIRQVSDQFENVLLKMDIPNINYAEEIRNIFEKIPQINVKEQLKSINDFRSNILHTFGSYDLLYFPSRDSYEKNTADKEINSKIVERIFSSEQEYSKEKSTIITLSPINDKVLKYLSENPLAFYQLDDRDFEIVMAEIYNKLGYNVELTKSTQDGGKDIIIRKPEMLGDFIYYVECKKNAAKRHIGVGVIRSLVGTINADRVNGGILATTSYFTPNAKKFITDNKYDYQIQMHDYDIIRKLLDQVV